MLELAKARDEAIRTRVAEGLMAPVNQLENRQMILSRELATIEARRSFEAASTALSLFYRDSEEQPVRVEIDRLPSECPFRNECDRDET
jgi:hypothetical protein